MIDQWWPVYIRNRLCVFIATFILGHVRPGMLTSVLRHGRWERVTLPVRFVMNQCTVKDSSGSKGQKTPNASLTHKGESNTGKQNHHLTGENLTPSLRSKFHTIKFVFIPNRSSSELCLLLDSWLMCYLWSETTSGPALTHGKTLFSSVSFVFTTPVLHGTHLHSFSGSSEVVAPNILQNLDLVSVPLCPHVNQTQGHSSVGTTPVVGLLVLLILWFCLTDR